MTDAAARPIRVLQLRSLRGSGGGPERTIAAYAERGGPPGFEVSVCYLRNRQDPDFVADQRASALGVHFYQVQERGAVDPRAWRELRSLLADLAPDVVHCHDYKANLLGLWMSRRLPFALLSSSHGWAATNLRERLVYYPGDRLLLTRFPRVVAVSDDIRAALLRSGARAENVVVVRNAVDTEALVREPALGAQVRAGLGLAPDAVVLGFVGRLDAEKRLDLLLETVALLRRSEPRLALLVVGDGRMRSPWTALAQRLGILDACRFVGRREDVPLLHHAMGVYVQSSRREGTSNALLEAMAMQTPIVATAVGGTAELIDNDVHGLLVPPDDSHALAEAIRHAMRDPQAAATRARSARRRAETELSLARWKEQMSGIYRELVAREVGARRSREAPATVGCASPPRESAATVACASARREPAAPVACASQARESAATVACASPPRESAAGADDEKSLPKAGNAPSTESMPGAEGGPPRSPTGSASNRDPEVAAAVSYIVPARNEAAGIARVVHSIFAQQTAARFEVLVVDNGSTDATAAAAADAGARVVFSNATTVAGARNDGARAAAGALLCFVDADCAVASDHLASVLAALKGGASAAGSRCVPPAGANAVQRAWALQRTATQACDVSWLSSGNLAIQRAAFDEVGGFDETLTTCEDSDIGYRLAARGHRLRCDPAIVAVHYGEPAGLREFVVKEAWRGRDSLRSFLRHGCPARELPSLVFPLLSVGLPVVGCVVALAGRPQVGAVVVCLGLAAPLLMALKTAYVRRQPRAAGTLMLLYSGWALGRCAALARELCALPSMLRDERMRRRAQ